METKLLGIPTQLLTRPLTEPLKHNSAFRLLEESRPVLASKLRERELSAALLSPLEYAKESSEYCIVPNVAAVSGEGAAVIRFREGVRNIRTVAADPLYAYEIVLTKIVLSESFEIKPQLLPMSAPVDAMLDKADAALLVGDIAFGNQSENQIDLAEEWFELTGTTFVHALWCGRESSLTPADVEMLQDSPSKGTAGISDIAQQFPKNDRRVVEEYLQSFVYTLDERVRNGLAEFMEYLYYLGIMPDVAELNFYKKHDELFSDISSN